jgi:undecaprenyl diphosphate synthase
LKYTNTSKENTPVQISRCPTQGAAIALQSPLIDRQSELGLETVDADGSSRIPRHIGIIMDGNGRWAQRQGRPRTDGHLEGLKTARKIVEAAVRLGLRYLTLYVFSTENWKRAESEVRFILALVKRYLVAELDHYRKDRLRVRHAGDLAGLPQDIAAEISKACEDTKDFEGMQVVLALNYGGRDEIIRAITKALANGVESGELATRDRRFSPDIRSDMGDSGRGALRGSSPAGGVGRNNVRPWGGAPPSMLHISEAMLASCLDNPDIPDPDLIIRTAGEFRTSNFLLWEAAYSEYYISDKLWPDWTEDDLKRAIAAYSARDRRYGGISV